MNMKEACLGSGINEWTLMIWYVVLKNIANSSNGIYINGVNTELVVQAIIERLKEMSNIHQGKHFWVTITGMNKFEDVDLSDINSMLGEEFGFLGTISVIGLFILIYITGYMISNSIEKNSDS